MSTKGENRKYIELARMNTKFQASIVLPYVSEILLGTKCHAHMHGWFSRFKRSGGPELLEIQMLGGDPELLEIR